MIIQINSGHNIKSREVLTESLTTLITKKFDRYSAHITRIELHLEDENSIKNSPGDKRCQLEARLKGLQPIVVTNFDDTIEIAVDGAIDKLKSALDTVIGKMNKH